MQKKPTKSTDFSSVDSFSDGGQRHFEHLLIYNLKSKIWNDEEKKRK